MKTALRVSLSIATALLTVAAFGQELAPGKYSGEYASQTTQGFRVRISLDIKSVADGAIEGTGSRYTVTQLGYSGTTCTGEFPLTGTLKGDRVDIRAAKPFGPSGDCRFRVQGTVADNKIQGKIGQNDIELSR